MKTKISLYDKVTNNQKRNSSYDSEKLKWIIKNSIELHCNIPNEKDISIWRSMKDKLSNLKNNIKYNTITLNSCFDFDKNSKIYLFDKLFYKDDLLLFTSEAYYTIYMTYRNEFQSIISKKGKSYSTDCGWGCMLRSAQMILANAIYAIKEEEYRKIYKYINETIKNDIINKTVLLFLDSPQEFEEVKHIKDLINMIKNIDKDIIISDVKSITTPFSIRNICQIAQLYYKDAGEWFSDITMIKIFQTLNNEFNPMGIEIFSFDEGVIYENEILELCFEESNKDDSILVNEKYYKLNKKGIIFVSLRLGLDKLETEYIPYIQALFTIPFNLGIIGGRSDYSYYFIGAGDKKLLYLDPHLNRKTINYSELEEDNTSYLIKELYQLDIKNISPALTIGFYFRNLSEYKKLNKSLRTYSEEYPIFKIKHKRDDIIYNDTNEDDF